MEVVIEDINVSKKIEKKLFNVFGAQNKSEVLEKLNRLYDNTDSSDFYKKLTLFIAHCGMDGMIYLYNL